MGRKPWFHCRLRTAQAACVFYHLRAAFLSRPDYSSVTGNRNACAGRFPGHGLPGAAKTIFISSVYHDLNGDPAKNLNEKFA